VGGTGRDQICDRPIALGERIGTAAPPRPQEQQPVLDLPPHDGDAASQARDGRHHLF